MLKQWIFFTHTFVIVYFEYQLSASSFRSDSK